MGDRRGRATATAALPRGLASSPMAKRRSRSGPSPAVEAQDFGRRRGALKRQAGAQRPGGGRLAAQNGVKQSKPGAGEEQRIALPRPPRPRRNRYRRRKLSPIQWLGLCPLRPDGASRRHRCGRARASCLWLELRGGFPNRGHSDSTCWLGGGQQECQSHIPRTCVAA